MDIELLSSTKYISGGGTSVGGLIIDYGTFDWSNFEKTKNMFAEHGSSAFIVMLKKQVFRNMGACLSPHSAYMQSLGLDTLVLRTERSVSNTLEQKASMGLRDTMIRLSVGIEDIDDLIEDINQAFLA